MRYAVESVAECWDEIVPLAGRHHASARFPWPFRPNREFYDGLERAKVLSVFTMRDGRQFLQGYATFVILDHPHMECRVASQDTIYVLPEARGYGSGKFLLWCDERLKALGAQLIVRGVTRDADFSPALVRIGYTLGDMLLSRRV